jgi:hypothetical protein
MPVRIPPLTERAPRILFEGIVDYAGLYPPTALPMAAAVRNYAHYRGGGAAWVLGRFVCPADALVLFSQHADALLPRDAGAIPWRLALIGSGDIAADMQAIAEFNERHRVCFDEVAALVDAYEVRASTREEIAQLDTDLPRDILAYIEVPIGPDAPALIAAVAGAGRRVKLRTGGVTADAFPDRAALVRALAACVAHDVPAKATAGLHHLLHGSYPVTPDAAALPGEMFGFLNVFLSAALLATGGTPAEAMRLLDEENVTAFELNDHSIAWRDGAVVHHFDRALLQRVRESVLVSFGSCSFTEPVDESRRAGFV